jgi:hypothetical protein
MEGIIGVSFLLTRRPIESGIVELLVNLNTTDDPLCEIRVADVESTKRDSVSM